MKLVPCILLSNLFTSHIQYTFLYTCRTPSPGQFFYGKLKTVSIAELTSPRFTVYGQTCVRFSYFLRGRIYHNIGLVVKLYDYYKYARKCCSSVLTFKLNVNTDTRRKYFIKIYIFLLALPPRMRLKTFVTKYRSVFFTKKVLFVCHTTGQYGSPFKIIHIVYVHYSFKFFFNLRYKIELYWVCVVQTRLSK